MVLSFIKIFFISILSLFSNGDQPVFKDGSKTLNQFVEENTVYPWYAKQNCIQGTIKVSFQLSKNGEVFDVKVKRGLGIDLDDEAIRLIKLTNHKWEVPSNHNENSEIIIPVKFSLQNYNCEKLSKQQIEKAITLYQTRQTLEDVVTSYYQNKLSGKVNTKNEKEIIRLKTELGFDEEFVAEQLAEANKMLAQGDKEEACKTLNFIRNIGFSDADDLIAQNCK